MIGAPFVPAAAATACARNCRRVLTSGINRLQPLDDIPAASFVTGPGAVARPVEIDANPALVTDLLQNAMASWKIDIAVAEVVNTLEELRFGRVFGMNLSVGRSEEHTSELQSRRDLVCRLLLEKKKATPGSLS